MNKQEIIEKLESVMNDIDTVLYSIKGNSKCLEDIVRDDGNRTMRKLFGWVELTQEELEDCVDALLKEHGARDIVEFAGAVPTDVKNTEAERL